MRLRKALGRFEKPPSVPRVEQDLALRGVVDFRPNRLKPNRGFGGTFHDVMPLGKAMARAANRELDLGHGCCLCHATNSSMASSTVWLGVYPRSRRALEMSMLKFMARVPTP